jgi:hypothetical protein
MYPYIRFFFYTACLITLIPANTSAAVKPVIFWTASPVKPNECVMVTGEYLADVTRVVIRKLTDHPPTLPTSAPPASQISLKKHASGWQSVKPVQTDTHCLKFIIPASEKAGVYACQLIKNGAESSVFFINTPDPWWLQGDEGSNATQGGWIRVFGRNLVSPIVSGHIPIHSDMHDPDNAERPIPPGIFHKTNSLVLLKSAEGRGVLLHPATEDIWSLKVNISSTLPPGEYKVFIHNGSGGNTSWSSASQINVTAPVVWPSRVFNVMDFYGADAHKEELRTLNKGGASVDRTEAVQAALKQAEQNGGGVIYFPPGVYTLHSPLQIPPHTILQGAEMGLVTLWWGKGNMALDGGSSERRLNEADKTVPPVMISGARFRLENMSIVLPRLYQTGIQAEDHLRMHRIRILVDRYWIRPGDREDGLAVRPGDDSTITDCDIISRGVGITAGRGDVIARNRIQAGKSNIDLAHADGVIAEDNTFISLDPTAYINLSGEGRNLYYAHNRHEAFFAQQSDFSWTFDGTGQAYLGEVESVNGANIQLANSPVYPNWAGEASPLWKCSAVAILSGQGAGQYRYATSNHGKNWTIDHPFDVNPDKSSIISIIPFRGKVLVIGNHFEDSGWVNMGYGSSFDVICASNQIYRAGALLNMGLRLKDSVMPSWYIQYLDNDIYEGHTLVQATADMRNPDVFTGTVTRFCIFRGDHIHADNSGSMDIGGNVQDAIIEGCEMDNPASHIQVDQDTSRVLIRTNHIAAPASERYIGGGTAKAVVIQ